MGGKRLRFVTADVLLAVVTIDTRGIAFHGTGRSSCSNVGRVDVVVGSKRLRFMAADESLAVVAIDACGITPYGASGSGCGNIGRVDVIRGIDGNGLGVACTAGAGEGFCALGRTGWRGCYGAAVPAVPCGRDCPVFPDIAIRAVASFVACFGAGGGRVGNSVLVFALGGPGGPVMSQGRNVYRFRTVDIAFFALPVVEAVLGAGGLPADEYPGVTADVLVGPGCKRLHAQRQRQRKQQKKDKCRHSFHSHGNLLIFFTLAGVFPMASSKSRSCSSDSRQFAFIDSSRAPVRQRFIRISSVAARFAG